MPDTDRFVVLVDVGYLYAAAGELVLNTPKRKEIRVDAALLIERLRATGVERGAGEFLRLYWYDAARDRVPTVEHREVASLPHVKLRLGNLNRAGVQKGVDALLRSDLESLARNRAVSDALLVAGDEDMIAAVEAAQAYGVRVHLLGVEPKYGVNQSERLVWEADTSVSLDGAFFDGLLTSPVRPAAAVEALKALPAQDGQERPPALPVPTPAQVAAMAQSRLASAQPARQEFERETMVSIGEHVVQKWLHTRGRDHLQDLLPGPILPPVIDHELLVEAEQELGASLRTHREAREAIRNGFWARVYREFGMQV